MLRQPSILVANQNGPLGAAPFSRASHAEDMVSLHRVSALVNLDISPTLKVGQGYKYLNPPCMHGSNTYHQRPSHCRDTILSNPKPHHRIWASSSSFSKQLSFLSFSSSSSPLPWSGLSRYVEIARRKTGNSNNPSNHPRFSNGCLILQSNSLPRYMPKHQGHWSRVLARAILEVLR